MALFKTADNFRCVKYRWSSPAAATVDIAIVERYTLVWHIVLQIITGDADATLNIGFRGNATTADPDYFMDSDSLAVITTTAMLNIMEAGQKGYYFNNAGGAVTATFAGTNTGNGNIFVFYTKIV